jgi:uncharacterized protein (TIGR02284 family)
MHVHTNEVTLKELNDLLKGEMTAVETYNQALGKLSQDLTARVDLKQCLASHSERAQRLEEIIRGLGGNPTKRVGLWGTLAKLIQGGAQILGDKAAIAALEEGEDHWLRNYQESLDKIEPSTARRVRDELLPAQLRTHDTMSALKRLQSSE